MSVTYLEVQCCGSFVGDVVGLQLHEEEGCVYEELPDGSVHWRFVDKSGAEFDPWKLNMQVHGGHQLCENHCLLMSRCFAYRKATTPEQAYQTLLAFWKLNLHSIISSSSLDVLAGAFFRLKEANKHTRGFMECWNKICCCVWQCLAGYPPEYLIRVLSSSLASRMVPTWK